MFIDISEFNNTSYTDLTVFAVDVINWVIGFAVFLSVIMVVVAGFKFIFSVGDSKKVDEASRTLLFSIIGLVIVFLAPTVIKYVIANFLGGF